MARKKKQRPVVIQQGAPEWMVTFGDLMSLLLTFFVLLFSVSEVKREKVFDIIKAIKVHWQIESPVAGFNIESLSEIIELLADKANESPDSSEGRDGKASETVEQAFGEKAVVSKVNDTLHLEIAGRIAFDEGSAEVKDEMRALLRLLQEDLRGYPNRIRIIGHASPLPLPSTSSFENHDDLAFHRALAVSAVLTGDLDGEPGVRPERIELSSRGRRDPLPGINVFEPEDRARLSRVEIIVTPENALKRFPKQKK